MVYLQQLVHDYLVLFAMVNVVGNLPIFSDLTRDLDRGVKARAFRTATAVGCSIAIGFAFLGDWMLRAVFQVDVNAFKIAGGILVFAVAARGVLQEPRLHPRNDEHDAQLAIFPMGFPFLAGPGTIVTTILLMQAEGGLRTAFAAVLVYATVLPLLFLSSHIERAVGRVSVLVVTRILYVFIAAKAVTFVLTGIAASR